jgi:predicted house-cleaning noncanonical NTP pyrophosphatase (MazG superfamily)
MIEYNKVVRSKIPLIIHQNGKKCSYEKMNFNDADLLPYLLDKVVEEAIEVKNAVAIDDRLDEIADLWDAISLLAKYLDISRADMEHIKYTKVIKRGSFIHTDSDGEDVVTILHWTKRANEA